MLLFVLQLCACLPMCFGQNNTVEHNEPKLSKRFLDSTGNFSLELLYAATKRQGEVNHVTSPFSVCILLAAILEGANGNTRQQLLVALRLPSYSSRETTRWFYQEISKRLAMDTTAAQFTKYNGIFVNWFTGFNVIEHNFRQISQQYYETDAVDLNFKNSAAAATINRAVYLTTEGWIPAIIDENQLNDTNMIITSAVYFKGNWATPFNVSSIFKQYFYNSVGEKIGEVNMMYNRQTYPYFNMNELRATVIELPYGTENRLSMILILPISGTTVQEMLSNFNKVRLVRVFQKLKDSQEQNIEVDCFIPSFKIDSNIDLTETLKYTMGLHDLFNPKKAYLGNLGRWPIRGAKFIQKTVIEVAEGDPTPNYTAVENATDNNVTTFKANRPFTYFVVEKHTNTIILAGVYQRPVLY